MSWGRMKLSRYVAKGKLIGLLCGHIQSAEKPFRNKLRKHPPSVIPLNEIIFPNFWKACNHAVFERKIYFNISLHNIGMGKKRRPPPPTCHKQAAMGA